MIRTDSYMEEFIEDREKALMSKSKTVLVEHMKRWSDLGPRVLLEPVFWLSMRKVVEGVSSIEGKEGLIKYYDDIYNLSLHETCSRCGNGQFSYDANFCRICGLKRDKKWLQDYL